MKRLFIALLLFPIYTSVAEDCDKINSCNYSSMWNDYSKFTVTYSNKKGEKGKNFTYIISDKESLITYETRYGTAQILTIPGVATLWRGIGTTGIKTSPGCYEDVRETYTYIQVYKVRALFFLGFSVKGGPALVSDNLIIDINNTEDTIIQIDPGYNMTIHGPWSLKGYINKGDNITFEISHDFMSEGRPVSIFLAGSWQNDPIIFPVKSTETLNGWLVCLSGQYTYDDGKENFTPIIKDKSKLKTIGDLRSLTQRSN